jgi:hypothetical protein
MTAVSDQTLSLAQEMSRVARVRARRRRDALVKRCDVLDDFYAGHDQRLPALPTLDDVAVFFSVDRGRLTTLVRHFAEEFGLDGWQPHHPRRPGCDVWTEEAVLRAALLLNTAVGCKSEVAGQLRYLLGDGQLPLMFSTTDAQLRRCARLYEKALLLVGDVHGLDGPEAIWRSLQDMPRYDVQALVVTLAAMVSVDQGGVGRYLCRLSERPGQAGSREHGLALLIPRPAKLFKRRRRPGSAPHSSMEPGGEPVITRR